MDNEKRASLGLSSAALHIMAMIFMLLDHMWATVLAYDWMTCVGRIAFPIFAFMIVEGFFHTSDLKKYLLRILVFAIISEIPFNLMYGGQIIYPMHQNVMWTFLLALLGLWLMEMARNKKKTWLFVLVCIFVSIIGFVLGYLLFVDYYGCGILTVFVFYFFYRGREDNIIVRLFKNSNSTKKIWTILCFIGQFACLYYINVEILGGFYYPVTVCGIEIELVQQSIALLALIPIWFYWGKQGYHKRWFKYFNYVFYPAHCLLLAVIAMIR